MKRVSPDKLEFISRINSDGSGTVICEERPKFFGDENY